MRDPFFSENLEKGQKKDLQVEEEGAVVEIIFVKVNLDGDGQFIPSVDLGPAGKTRGEDMYAFLGSQCDEVILVEQRRSRTDKAHVPFQYTDELRQLVEARFAEEFADGG